MAASTDGETSASTNPPQTTGGTTTSDPDPDSSGTTGNTFLEPTDTSCAAGEDGPNWHCTWDCSVILNDCPEDEKCMPWANDGGDEWNTSRCSPLPPELAAEGEPCTAEGSAVSGIDDCVGGSMCWGVDPETLTGTCRSFCDPSLEGVCGEAADCVPLNGGQVPVCLTPCNPLDPSICAEDEGCRFILAGDRPYCLPLVGGVVTDSGMACGETSCGLDSMCLPGDLTPVCRDECCSPWCDLNELEAADEACALIDPALFCMPLFPGGAPPKGPLVGLEALGVCAANNPF